jgi:hypothetical protein
MTKPQVLVAKRKHEFPYVLSKVPTGSVLIYVAGEVNKKNSDAIVKISSTKDKSSLIKSLRESGREMIPLALWWGTGTDVQAVKHEFQYTAVNSDNKLHYRGIGDREWFIVDRSIKAWLVFLRKQHWVTDDIEQVHTMGYVTNPNSWLPPVQKEHNGGLFDHLEIKHQPHFEELNTDSIMEGDYYSPSGIAKICREQLWKGIGIELDPASCKAANSGDSINEGIRAYKFYGMREDGLTKQWNAKTVWLNPPFKQWDDWIPKALHEFDSGRTKEMCILSFSTISTADYFNEAVIRCNALLVPRRRWNFWGPKASSSSPAGSFLYYFGPNRDRFKEVFKHLGAIKGDF